MFPGKIKRNRIVLHDEYKPRYYNPKKDHVILGNHVFWMSACPYNEWTSVDGRCVVVAGSLRHIGACAERMPINAFQDMHWCLQFADAWEEDEDADWEDAYLDEKVPASATAKH